MLYKKNKISFITILISFSIGLVFTGLVLLYTWKLTPQAFVDALFIAGFLLFSIGWFFFISNENVFSLIVYGVQSFWLNMVGKRKEKSYIQYITEKPKISSHIYKSLWLASLPYLIISLLLLFFVL